MLTSEAECCELCGTPLQLSAGAPGCLNCLLDGGEAAAIEREFQHYEIALAADGETLDELGRGAMGITYRAVDQNLGSPVALKVISARYSKQSEARARFRHEARAAARLRHPNVASVFHYGETASGHCFYAMELVEGETLEAKVRREGSLGAEVVLEIGHQVARALVAAEKHGLIHRDLKPSNLMVLPNEQSRPQDLTVKVIDFGLAKIVSDPGGPEPSEQPTFSGTPGFASPEQSQSGSGRLDIRSDIYSLGATLCYALCGQPPGNPVAQLRAAKVPPPLLALLQSMLAAEPGKRPQVTSLLGAIERCRRQLARIRQRPRWLAAAASVVLLAAAFALTKSRTRHNLELTPEKSIAVLPFENLSDEKANAFFADGIQDDILASLAKIKELKVISRASVMPYRKSSAQSLHQIAQALGVANILQGSVRRAGDRVMVNVQLVDAQNDRLLWADHFDRTLADALGLQGELASEIARKLHSTLSLEEKARLERKPTENAAAYVAYLRGLASERWAEMSPESIRNSEQFYREAVKLDPKFALAWARLAIGESNLYFLAFDRTPERLAAARESAEAALKLRPDLGEVQLAQGYYRYYGLSDYSSARKSFAKAKELMPNSAEVLLAISFLDRRQGHWQDALDHQQEAIQFDPRNPVLFVEHALTYLWLGQFPEARAVLDRALSLAPNDAELIATKAISYQAEGNLKAAGGLLATLPLQPNDSRIFDTQVLQLLYERRYQPAITALKTALASPAPSLGQNIGNYYALLTLAQIRSGDREGARATGAEARAKLERLRRRQNDSEYVAANLALIDAILGDKSAALQEVEKTAKITDHDSVRALTAKMILAEVQAQFGERDAVLATLPQLLQKPHAGLISRTPLTPALLNIDPIWDPVRDDPRMQKILAMLPDSKPSPEITPEPSAPEKSLAVLPFENLNTDKENASFAAGVQDEILSDLAKVADLKVISRTSVMSYPSAAGRNLREIAQALGVSHIVEGSVQRNGDRIRVTAQLIDARTDNHLWAEHFDRKLTDIFAVESEIAQRIADQLQGKLSPVEKIALAEQPTSDLKAYELYTEARTINVWENWQGAEESLKKKAEILRQAVARDPGFALAYSALAKTECDLAGYDSSETHLRAAKEAAEAALRCARNQPEGHRELARYYLFKEDRKRARAEIGVARRDLPNDSETLRILGEIEAAEHHWDEAVADLERATELDPRNDEVRFHLDFLYKDLRRYKEWEAHLARVTASNSPQSYWFQLSWAELKLDTGDLASAQAFLAQIPSDFSPTFEIWNMRIAAALYARDYDAASHIVALVPANFAPWISVAFRPNTALEGLIAHYRGKESRARTIYTAALKQIQNPSSQDWSEQDLLTEAAICDAGLGRKEKAISEARRALDLSPPEKNLRTHVSCRTTLANVYASLGETKLALDQLEAAAKLPKGPTYGDLMLDPAFDNLRSNSRFKEIVSSLAGALPAREQSTPETSATALPSESLSASQLYAEAREIYYWEDWKGVKNSLERKAALLREAIRRDPNYALAYCALVKTECDLVQDTNDPPGTHIAEAKKAVDTVLAREPKLPEAHRELGRYYLYAAKLGEARAELATAGHSLPNDAEIPFIEGQIDFAQDKWDEATAAFARASALDPTNDEISYYLTDAYAGTRRYREWDQLMKQADASDSPRTFWYYIEAARLKLALGDATAAQALLAHVPPDFSPNDEVWKARAHVCLYLRDYDALGSVIARTPEEIRESLFSGLSPNTVMEAVIARYRGDEGRARTIFTAARKNNDMPWARTRSPDRKLIYLAICDAGLGRKAEAISEARQSVAIASQAGIWGLENSNDRARDRRIASAVVYALLGEKALALDELTVLAEGPAGLTYGDLLRNPCWDSLRGDPRFEELVASMKPR